MRCPIGVGHDVQVLVFYSCFINIESLIKPIERHSREGGNLIVELLQPENEMPNQVGQDVQVVFLLLQYKHVRIDQTIVECSNYDCG